MRGMTVVSGKTLTIALRNPLSLSMQVVRTLNLRLALSFLNVCMPNNSLWSRYISINAMLYILPTSLAIDCILFGISQHFQGLFLWHGECG